MKQTNCLMFLKRQMNGSRVLSNFIANSQAVTRKKVCCANATKDRFLLTTLAIANYLQMLQILVAIRWLIQSKKLTELKEIW